MNNDMLVNHKFEFVSFCCPSILQKDELRYQINSDSHLIHILNGSGILTVDDSKYPFSKGSVLSVPPETEFKLTLKPGVTMKNIHYRIWLPGGDLLGSKLVLPAEFKPDYFSEIEYTFSKMDSFSDKRSGKHLRLYALAYSIVMRHLSEFRLVRRFNDASDNRARQIRIDLESRESTSFDADSLAAEHAMSVSQMNRVFRKHFNTSPHRYWEKYRFRRICEQMISSSQSIKNIAEEFGFENQAYFSRWFKKMAGIPPAHYRKNNLLTSF